MNTKGKILTLPNSKTQFFKLSFNQKEYEINFQKFSAIISYFKRKEIELNSKIQIEKYMDEYCLWDNVFLENMN